MKSIDISIHDYLNELKTIQTELYALLDTENGVSVEYQHFFQILDDFKVRENPDKLRSVLHLLSKINSNYHSDSDNLEIYEQIINNYKDEIQKNFINCEIFTIFEFNVRILLFLIKSDILQIDNYVLTQMKINQYMLYFFPEIKNLLKKEEVEEITKIIPYNFEEKRQKGETDSYMIDVIRNDSIDDFIVHVHETNCSLDSKIKTPILETNSFLIQNRDLTIIEYATFFGSIQIFQYLISNGIEYDQSLWILAIHSKNVEIISFLEEKKIKPEGKLKINMIYRNFYLEALKCHHNDIANYVFQNIQKNFFDFIQSCALEYYNFEYVDINSVKKSSFYDLCAFDYTYIVRLLINSKNIQINALKRSLNQVFKIKKNLLMMFLYMYFFFCNLKIKIYLMKF